MYGLNYTIPSDNRELQHTPVAGLCTLHYTIPSDNRELQREYASICDALDYTIPSDNRELQRICIGYHILPIIPYQVITGNYNYRSEYNNALQLYHTK